MDIVPYGAEVDEMNAHNPNPGEREADALRRAQRAHEPSMEEILASIRAIIADDRDPELAKATPRKGIVSSTPPVVYASNGSGPPIRAVTEVETPRVRDESQAALTEPVTPASPPSLPKIETAVAPALVSVMPTVVWARTQIESVAAPTPEPAPAIASNRQDPMEEPLLSDATDRAVTASFDALAASLALQSAELAERMMREMLRPMIKTWLDEHLPSLVERLVRAEIQRVARGGR